MCLAEHDLRGSPPRSSSGELAWGECYEARPALAQVTSKWRGALAIFQEFEQSACEPAFMLRLGITCQLVAMRLASHDPYCRPAFRPTAPSRVGGGVSKACNSAVNYLRGMQKSIAQPSFLALYTEWPFLLRHKRDFELSPRKSAQLRHGPPGQRQGSLLSRI